MSWIMVDVEADGPIPGDYSMISIGAIVIEPSLNKTFHVNLRPISKKWIPEALAVSGFSRETTEEFDHAAVGMAKFKGWLNNVSEGRPYFISDNNGLTTCLYAGIFGISSIRIHLVIVQQIWAHYTKE